MILGFFSKKETLKFILRSYFVIWSLQSQVQSQIAIHAKTQTSIHVQTQNQTPKQAGTQSQTPNQTDIQTHAYNITQARISRRPQNDPDSEIDNLGPVLSEILATHPELKIEDSSATVSEKRGMLGLRYIMNFGEMAKEIQVALNDMGISSDAFNAFYYLHAALNPERFSFTDTIAKLKGHYYGQEFKPTPEQALLWQKRQLLDVINPNLESREPGVQVDPKLKVVIAGEDYIERVIHDLVYSSNRSDDIAERKFKTIFVDLNSGVVLSLSEDTVDEAQKVVLSVSRLVRQTRDKVSYQLKPSYGEILQSIEGLYIEYETLLSEFILNYNSRLTNSDTIRRGRNVYVADTVQQLQRDSSGLEGKKEFFAEGEVYLLFDSPLNPEDLVYIVKSVVEYAAKISEQTAPKGKDYVHGTSLNPANHLQSKSCQAYLFAK